MMRMRISARGVFLSLLWGFATLSVLPSSANAQSGSYERTFARTKADVENAIKKVQPTSGRLPVLDGFARPGSHPFDNFQRAYYQCAIQVTATSLGGSLVRVSAKITAWYADPDPVKSGYEVLPSNGRLETDLLDRIAELLGGSPSPAVASSSSKSSQPPPGNEKFPSAPSALLPKGSNGFPSGSAGPPKPVVGSPFEVEKSTGSDHVASLATQKAVTDKRMAELTKEAQNLAEILRNQAHPNNLIAVKNSETPVLISPIEGAKVLFLATAGDEFEILDTSANWVHIRISGLSRGWIRKSSVEMPDASAAAEKTGNTPAPAPATAERFQVKDEQTATFPATWEPLQGKTVQILTVQQIAAVAPGTGARARLEFTKSLFEKKYAELKQTASTAEGIVVIFDSEDGGMVAATLAALQQWKGGTLSDEAFWRRCFFDPPEAFTAQTVK